MFQLLWRNLRHIFTRNQPFTDAVQGPDLATTKPRSLFLRHLDCGSCNGCELELNALSNPIYDMAQYGIRFESSPRHADVIILTGPYTRNLDNAAQLTTTATPDCRIVTVGDCTENGGVFQDSYAIVPRPPQIESAVAAHIPGCPPTPTEILRVLLYLPEPK
ncbi:MAG: hydrogenase [Chloroflexi bacterium]|nr:MAG: hydrogenase [Chloroflexota bacterium]